MTITVITGPRTTALRVCLHHPEEGRGWLPAAKCSAGVCRCSSWLGGSHHFGEWAWMVGVVRVSSRDEINSLQFTMFDHDSVMMHT